MTNNPGRDLPLRSLGVPPAAVAELAELIDSPAAEAVVYARAHTETRVSSSGCTLDVRATPAGRVVLYRMPTRPGRHSRLDDDHSSDGHPGNAGLAGGAEQLERVRLGSATAGWADGGLIAGPMPLEQIPISIVWA